MELNMTLSQKPLAHPEVVLREEFDDWAVLFHPDTAAAVGINPTGVAIWKLLDGTHEVEDIVQELNTQFSNVPDAAPQEIMEFIQTLTDDGFIGYEADVS